MKFQVMNFGKGEKRITLVHLNKPLQGGVAGMLTSRLFSEKIAIVVDDTPSAKRDYDFACLACGENGSFPRIKLMREIYYDIKRGLPYARMVLFHELGHYFYKHHMNMNEYRDEKRKEFASNGKISKEEEEADLFAVEYLGSEVVTKGLEHMCELVKIEYDNCEEAVSLILKELEERIKVCKNS